MAAPQVSQLYDSVVVSGHDQNGSKESVDALSHRNPLPSRTTPPSAAVVIGSHSLIPSGTFPGPMGVESVSDSAVNGVGDPLSHSQGTHTSSVYTTLTTAISVDRVPSQSADPCNSTSNEAKSEDALGRLKSNTLRFHAPLDPLAVGLFDSYYNIVWSTRGSFSTGITYLAYLIAIFRDLE
ncbi:unnamed protein product [Echinostoma caproni]|uniref:Solute carrier family 40 protein n=1 Tax=Echinostoma caproni TaxID=27848 RepID=A0A183AYG6_9TREM|nr:unnamed protein product [Echinostoma caproni]